MKLRLFSEAPAPSTRTPTPEDPPVQTVSLSGAEVWTIDDLRNDILNLLDTATLRQILTLDHQTCENIMRIRYRHLDWKIYKEMERLITPPRQPLYFAAVTTVDIRRPPREESGLRRESRSNYVARRWLPLLPSLPALQHARFEDLVLKKVSSLGGVRPKFEARRVICQPVNLAVKNPLSLAKPCMVGYDFDIHPSIDVELFSVHLRTDHSHHRYLKTTTSTSIPSEPPKVFPKLLRQLVQSRDVFSYHIGSLTLGAPLPLSDFISLYRTVYERPRSPPPSNFRLDCTHYEVESLEAFCQAASPTLVQLELGPITGMIPTLTLEKLFLDFDWATLGSIRSFKISVKMSTFDDWLAAFHHRTSYYHDRSCRSDLNYVTIVFHGMPIMPDYYRKVEADRIKQQSTDRIINQVMFDPFITRCREIFHSGVNLSFKLWRDHAWAQSGNTIDLPLLDELVKEKIRNSREKK